jgi:hypothetical protein
MRKVIYTSIVGGYDSLRQPGVVDESFDYICFSDDFKESRIGVWEIRAIPCDLKDGGRRSRYAKILPHTVLSEYDISVWMDANITVKDRRFYDAVDAAIASGALIAQVPHPYRDCVYEEAAWCYKDTRISLSEALRQIRHLASEGFPRHFGMFENNLIFRRHNDPKVIRISEEWWKEYETYSARDQLSLMPVYHREGFMPELLLGEGVNTRNTDLLEVEKHPGTLRITGTRGIRRLPLKIVWTWRKIVASVMLR